MSKIDLCFSSNKLTKWYLLHDPYFAQKKLDEVGAEYLTKIVQWACQECRITWKSNQLWWHLFRQPEIKGGGAKDPPGRFYGNHFLLVVQTSSFHSELATIWGQFSTCWNIVFSFCWMLTKLPIHGILPLSWVFSWSCVLTNNPIRRRSRKGSVLYHLANCSFALSKSYFPQFFLSLACSFEIFIACICIYICTYYRV